MTDLDRLKSELMSYVCIAHQERAKKALEALIARLEER